MGANRIHPAAFLLLLLLGLGASTPLAGQSASLHRSPDRVPIFHGDFESGNADDWSSWVAPCEDLVESNVLGRWSAHGDGSPTTQLSVLGAGEAVGGAAALRAVTDAAFFFALRYTVPGAPRNVAGFAQLSLAIRGENHNDPTWQGNFPLVILEDQGGHRQQYTPTSQLLSEDGASWRPVRVPLAGGAGWTVSGSADLTHITAIEVAADTWGAGFTLDLDRVSFGGAGQLCTLQCPGGCGSHGRCDAPTFSCLCDLGWNGTSCGACAADFVPQAGQCVPPGDAAWATWPNPASGTNGDAWLRYHHAEVERMEPKVLVLNFVNASTTSQVQALIDQILTAFAAGSKPRGYEAPGAPAQVAYQLAKPIVDLRNGQAGHPAAPPGWPYENSTLYPRRAEGEPGAWSFDYAELFSPAFAPYYGFADPGQPGGFADPGQPGQFLDLCQLIDSGRIHELWVVGSGDVPDVSAAEVLEHKQRYTATGNAIPGAFDACAGNGCFDADVPRCARSVRIGWVNYNRGPGCYLHSLGHGLESTAARGVAPGLTHWFLPFAGFDLDSRWGLPFSSFYGISCDPPGPCIEHPSPAAGVFHHLGTTYTVNPFDAVCGNVHFPPNGQSHYDYFNPGPVLTTCTGFGRHAGAGGDDLASLVDDSAWSANTFAGDCGGEFLVWWYQNMPAWGTQQSDEHGRPFLSVWPYRFY